VHAVPFCLVPLRDHQRCVDIRRLRIHKEPGIVILLSAFLAGHLEKEIKKMLLNQNIEKRKGK
jgi:hypothetical protein